MAAKHIATYFARVKQMGDVRDATGKQHVTSDVRPVKTPLLLYAFIKA
jgi:hypothetical protein